MCPKPLIEEQNCIAIWIELLFRGHEVSNIPTLVLVSIEDWSALHHEILKHSGVLLFRFLQPECKAQPFFSRHLSVRIGLCHRATVQQKRTPSAVPPRRCFQLLVSDRNQLMELSLACPFSLC